MNLKEWATNIILTVGVLLIIILAFVLVVNKMGIAMSEKAQENYDKCCGGMQCTDTYWDNEQQKCIIGYPDTNFIPAEFNWIFVVIALGVGVVLTIFVRFIAMKNEDGSDIKKYAKDERGEPNAK